MRRCDFESYLVLISSLSNPGLSHPGNKMLVVDRSAGLRLGGRRYDCCEPSFVIWEGNQLLASGRSQECQSGPANMTLTFNPGSRFLNSLTTPKAPIEKDLMEPAWPVRVVLFGF